MATFGSTTQPVFTFNSIRTASSYLQQRICLMFKVSIQSSSALLGLLLATSCVYGQNLLTNGSFETGALDMAPPSPWTVVQGGFATELPEIQDVLSGQANPVAAPEGSNYLRLSAESGAGANPGLLGAAIVEQITSTDVELGVTYTLNLHHNRNQGGNNKNLIYALGYDDGSGFTELSSLSYRVNSEDNRSMWVELTPLSHTVVEADAVPAGADIGVRITNQTNSQLQAFRGFVDDVQLTTSYTPISPLQPISGDGLGGSLINGSFENVVEEPGGNPLTSGAVLGSNTSLDFHASNPLTVTQWAPYVAEDPNGVVGRYGEAGTVSTNSFYLDANSSIAVPSVGFREITLNSADGYRHGLVNEDVLSQLAPKFLNPNAQYEISVDVTRRNDVALGNATATATLALTDSTTDPTDLSNAITDGTASLIQDSIPVGLNAEALTLSVSASDLIAATQLNLVLETVNTGTVTLPETNPGRDVASVSQVSFDNLVIKGYLPGDSDGDFDVDEQDYNAWKAGYGNNTTAEYFKGDFDNNGSVDAGDYTVWRDNYTGSLDTPELSSNTVPEPTALLMLACGSWAFINPCIRMSTQLVV